MNFTLFYSRRHHAVCLSENGKGLYLIGGFGKKRLILDKVEYLCLETRDVVEIPAMPSQLFSPASSFLNGRLYVIKNQIFEYEPNLKSWSNLLIEKIPKNIEFNRAIVYKDSIYLTGNHSYDLFRFKPDKSQPHIDGNVVEPRHELRHLGKFFTETQNVCLVGDELFNFSTDPFEYKSTVETYNIKTGKFKIVWEKETEELDFSPYQSLGCFPLVIY